MVYYRKYRPQTIEELDLDSVRERLSSILSAKELPHAFLFTGPKGLGKTSAARILAKAINCEGNSKLKTLASRRGGQNSELQVKSQKLGPREKVQQSNNKTIEPCNVCDNCVSITNGSNIDVLEIDAASNRGIDEIRDLRDKIKFAPASLSRKVYIIDEVHMLTTDAFNALLKTLEEPPSHAIFILCTTEIEKVPPTIVSRTFHVQFNKPTNKEIVRSLTRIIKGEKLDVEESVTDEIYKLSESSFRDAAKILEELAISSPNKKITNETLTSTYKTAGLSSQVNDLLSALSKKDLQSSMKIIENLAQKGADFKFVTEKIAEVIHGILMARAKVGSTEFDVQEMETGEFKLLLERINESYRDIKFSVLPQIPLELVVIEWCLKGGQKSPRQDLGQREFRVQDGNKKEEKETKIEDRSSENPQKAKPPEQLPKAQDDTHGVLFNANSKPDNFIAEFLMRIKQDNHSIAGILRGCRLVEITANQVLFETEYKFHKDKLGEARTASILDKRASELLRENVRVTVNLVAK